MLEKNQYYESNLLKYSVYLGLYEHTLFSDEGILIHIFIMNLT